MKKNLYFIFAILVLGVGTLEASPARTAMMNGFAGNTLSFALNEGQSDSLARFISRTPGSDVFLAPTGVTLLLGRETESSRTGRAALRSVVFNTTQGAQKPIEREYHALTLRFMGANENPAITGEERLSWKSNYFLGNNPAEWKTDVPNYSKVRYHDLYPGVDMMCYGANNSLKYDLVVRPGADPIKIRFAYEGVSALRVNAAGDLEADTPLGTVVEKKPYCYQEIGGKKKEISARYVIRDNTAKEYGFIVDDYDAERPLVIDPELVYSTLLGGNNSELECKIAVDAAGCMYVAGVTYSSDFPVTSGVYDTTLAKINAPDLYLTKFDQTGTSAVFSTYLGGQRNERLAGISIDSNGNVYLAGCTGSSDFPRTPGSYAYSPGYDVTALFLTKLNASGNGLVFSSVFGKDISSSSISFGLDDNNHAFLTGHGFIDTTPGALQTDPPLPSRGSFVCKFSEDGSRLIYATYFGGQSTQISVNGFAIDRVGNVCLTGYAGGDKGFPLTPGALCDTLSPGFLCKINPEGSAYVFSTHLFLSVPRGLTVDDEGFIYLTTSCTEFFPVTPGTYEYAGNPRIILCKLSPDGSCIVFSAKLFQMSGSPVVDSKGRIFLFGEAVTYDPIPTTPDAFDHTCNDLYFCEFDASCGSLLYGTYLGSSGKDYARSMCDDNKGNVYLTGITEAGDFPVTNDAFDRTFEGGTEAFLCKFSFDTGPNFIGDDAPKVFCLNPAFPNPFNASTSITFTLPKSARAELAVYSVTGQRVRTLVSGPITAGTHTATWDGRDDSGRAVSSGVYISRLTSGKNTATGRMALVK